MSQCLTRIFLIGFHEDIPNNWVLFAVLVLSTVLIAAAGYIINDYFDVKIDLINKPTEVYIGREISRRKALIIHQILSGAGVFLGIFLGWKIFILNIFAVTILWFYASVFKKKPFIGNFIVALLTALAIFEIALYYNFNEKWVYVYAVFALFVNLIREIIKDMEDIEGDRSHLALTLPIIFGIRKTKKLIYFLFILLLISVLIFLIKINNSVFWQIYSVLGLLALYLVVKIIKADRKSHFNYISKLCKYLMILGMLSMVFVQNVK